MSLRNGFWLAPLVLAGLASAQCGETGELISVSSLAPAAFGYRMDSSSKYFVVSNATEVFVFDSQSLLQLAVFVAPPVGDPNTAFAQKFSCSDDYLVVGAMNTYGGDGTAYVYDLNTFQDLGELAPAVPNSSLEQFGRTIEVHGSTAVVGGRHCCSSPRPYYAYVYELGAPHQQVALLTESESNYAGVFALGEDHLAVSGNKRVYIYETSGYTEVAVIPQQPALDIIEALAVLDGRVYVGHTLETVLVFDIATQALVDELTPSFVAGGGFGSSLTVVGDSLANGRLVVGQPGEGTCYVYDTANHAELGRYVPSSAVIGTEVEDFGRAVGMSGDRLLLGSLGRAVYFDTELPCELTTFCYGDGSEAPCLCGNLSAVGAREGCRNSTGVGARLRSTGSASIIADDLQFHVHQGPGHRPGVFVQGTTAISTPFFDGVFCMGPPTARLQFGTLNSLGELTSQGSIATQGGVSTPGSTRHYQFWFRDSGGVSPCGTAANLTNGVRVDWI